MQFVHVIDVSGRVDVEVEFVSDGVGVGVDEVGVGVVEGLVVGERREKEGRD